MQLRTRNGIPLAPVELADEVEAYARTVGRSATLHFFPTAFQGRRVLSGTWVVRLTLRCNDKRMVLYQQGRTGEPPVEDVWIHEWNPRAGHKGEPDYLPLDILQMGCSGLREFLEKGNMWSGRGQFDSLEEQLQDSRERSAASREKIRADAKFSAVKQAVEKRRFRFKIPFIRVTEDVREGGHAQAPAEPAMSGRPAESTNQEKVS